MMTTRYVVLAALCAVVGCSSPTTKNNESNNGGDGCEALKVGMTMSCVEACGTGGTGGSDASFLDVGSSEPPVSDSGSNAPPAPDFGRPVSDLGQPDFGPPIDFGTPADFGTPPDAGDPNDPDAGFQYADFCELTLNEDGTISEWHGDNEETGTWTCSDGVLRIENQFSGEASYVLNDDGCLEGSNYSFR